MNVNPDLRLNLPKIKPEIRRIVSTNQRQPSHYVSFFNADVIIALYVVLI
jgi:hypothetical protein